MLMSMKIFHLPSGSCHGRRSSSSHFLVSSPATTLEFNSKFLNLHSCHGTQHSSPATTMEFNSKFLSIHSCHGSPHSSKEPVLGSPAKMKVGSALFAQPRNNEQEHTSSDDDGHKKQLLEFVIREANQDILFWSSAWLKSGLPVGEFNNSMISEKNRMKSRFLMRATEPYICLIAVRKGGENMLTGMSVNGVGTLDFDVECLPQGEACPEHQIKCGVISKLVVHESVRLQGVGTGMLKYLIEHAREDGIPKLYAQVPRVNIPALALFRKMGFTINAIKEEPNQCECCLNL